MRYAQIDAHRDKVPVRWACSAMSVSPRSYYQWRRRGEGARQRSDRRLLAEIRASFAQSDRTYGSPRVTKDLKALGYRVSEKRVARLMREAGLVAVLPRRYRVTTDAGHTYPVTPNLLDRRFAISSPNRVWVADITYVSTEEGWLYMAALMDLYSRRVVGWNTAERMDRHRVLTALERALRRRRPEAGLIHHSDRGSQYASYEYRARLASAQAISSMSGKGNCYDNAAMESFFSSLKRERVHRRRKLPRQVDHSKVELSASVARGNTLGGIFPKASWGRFSL